MPLVDKTNELSMKVIELAGQYEAGNYGDIKSEQWLILIRQLKDLIDSINPFVQLTLRP